MTLFSLFLNKNNIFVQKCHIILTFSGCKFYNLVDSGSIFNIFMEILMNNLYAKAILYSYFTWSKFLCRTKSTRLSKGWGKSKGHMLGSVESDSPECQYKGAIPRVPPGAAEAQDSLGTDTWGFALLTCRKVCIWLQSWEEGDLRGHAGEKH